MTVLARVLQPRRWRRRRQLELIEDALKHVHAGEERGQPVTVESLAGALGISSSSAAVLARELHERGLMATREGLTLTPAGEEWARRIVRAHRLWERYLADEVRVGPEEVHRLADRKEHRLTLVEIEELAARLGYPQRDPHGDPIPAATGELRVLAAIPLTVAEPDRALRIVHVEDEPEDVYARLAALELDLDRILVVTERTPERLTLELEGARLDLSPVDAANVFVLPEPEGRKRPPATLADLRREQTARITALRMSGLRRRRLLDLGFTPGTRVECALRGPLGEPRAYRVRGTLVALRDEEARRIEIELPPGGEER